MSSNVAENQRVVILSGLVAANGCISAASRNEPVFSNIVNTCCLAQGKPVNRSDIPCIDSAVAIHISSRQPASRQRSSEKEEMPLHRDHIDGVDVSRAWRASSLRWCYGIGPAIRKD